MPRRGDNMTGGVELCKTLNINSWALQCDVQKNGPNIALWNSWDVQSLVG